MNQNGSAPSVPGADHVWGQLKCPFGDVTLCVHDSGMWHILDEGMTEPLQEAGQIDAWLAGHMKEHENAKE